MRPRISIITLGVDDLERALTFYRDGLGLPTRGIVGTEYPHGAVVFFDLLNGQKLAVWSRKDMAHEAKVPLGPRSATEFSLGHLVRSKAEVDALIDQARRAGAVVTDPPHDAFWGGYTGSFQDLDGHLWEIAWNPEMDPGD
jgi:catechol 2,3-dioxygenase-like lactoylglutathione lyase family enzyme